MEKVRPWCGQPSDRGRLKNRTEQNICIVLLRYRAEKQTDTQTDGGKQLHPRATIVGVGNHQATTENTRLLHGRI